MVPTVRNPRRGVYLLPTFFTTGNVLCGFFCIIEAQRGHFAHAAVLIVVAGLLDALDGRIARLTGSTSEFGVQFDSLADFVSFGVAPALLSFYWGLTPFRRTGWLIAFLFVVCAATRLARFNVQSAVTDRRWFVGMPSPAAAGTVAAVAFALPEPTRERWMSALVAVLVTTVAFLMVSRFRYRSFKDFDLKSRRSSVWVVGIGAALAVVLAEPRYALAALASVYLVSGPLGWIVSTAGRPGGQGGPPGGGKELRDAFGKP